MASGNTLVRFLPFANEPPTSNFATLDTRNNHPVLDFDGTTSESAVFTDVLPRHYSGGGVTVRIIWAATSATSGNCVWRASFEHLQPENLDIDADSFAAEQGAASSAPGTSGHPKVTDIAFTNGAAMDNIVVGEAFRLKIRRDPGDAGDTMTGDAELISVEIRET